eukprot:12402873-Karenia_brevis.AAC.1
MVHVSLKDFSSGKDDGKSAASVLVDAMDEVEKGLCDAGLGNHKLGFPGEEYQPKASPVQSAPKRQLWCEGCQTPWPNVYA